MAKVNKNALLKSQQSAGGKELLAVVASARKRVEGRILEAAAQKNFASAASVRDNLYNGIAIEYARLNRGVDDWTRRRGKTVSKAWYALAIDDLPSTAAKGMTFDYFSKKYLDDIVARINPSTASDRIAINAPLGRMLDEDIRAVRAVVSDVIREGAVSGMNYPDMSREMQKRLQKVKPGAVFIDRAGRKWKADSYFGMLNRTLHGNVARETYMDTCAEAGYDLVRVMGRSTYPDSPCIPFEGEILSLTGKTKGYTTLAEAEADGLFHPNCIHALEVFIP